MWTGLRKEEEEAQRGKVVRDVSERKELLESESESPVSDRVKLRVAEEDGAE